MLRISKISRISKAANYLAAVALLVIYTGDVHSHVCMDGFEAPVSYHADNISGHDDHAGEDIEHHDVDIKISPSTLQAKSAGIDNDHLAGLSTVLPQVQAGKPLFSHVRRQSATVNAPTAFLPPLRAPPPIA